VLHDGQHDQRLPAHDDIHTLSGQILDGGRQPLGLTVHMAELEAQSGGLVLRQFAASGLLD
jgi:hypothetical protein